MPSFSVRSRAAFYTLKRFDLFSPTCIILIDGKAKSKKQTMAAMHVRVRPSVKAAAVRMAQEDKCSMAEWLEWLIEAEAARLDGKKVRGP
jgi:predicted HicB family RNase H-like nuclease